MLEQSAPETSCFLSIRTHMAQHRDRPPVLRVLVLLLALVSTALALAALSPAQPEATVGAPATPVVAPGTASNDGQ
ncbi:MAG: hypothetical protein IT501_03475 [Rubrivivax sp.]|nr:hypothetical protein [Rubrivivax sp.]